MPFDQAILHRPIAIRDGRSYSVLTGHPPPARQIADQVRVPGGFTAGRPGIEGPRIAVLPGTGRGHGTLSLSLPLNAAALLRWLLAWDPCERLPTLQRIAAAAGLHDVRQLDLVLEVLVDRKEIGLWRGPIRFTPGKRTQMVVTMRRSGVTLRTLGAPGGIVP